MNGQITTAAELGALPTAEAIAEALLRYETGGLCHYGQTCGLCDCGRSDQTAEQRREWDAHQLDRARAVLALIPPQRCAPSEDEVAEALHADAYPVIVAAVLKPIRDLHREQFQFCRDCDADYPCPTIQLCDEIESSAKGGE